ncbi:MAG TPA: outer membrane beta-barrel protein, partial [Sphingobacterium sp.]|nr:outer membrane beta-barrel protein [Sphingobacterium sp.]
AGGYLDARIVRGFHLYPEISLQGKGARVVKFAELGGSEIIQRTNWLDFVFNFIGKVPVGDLGNVFGGAGPYLGFAMNGENTYPDGSTSAVIIYKENLKSIDYGVNCMAGLRLGQRLTLNANYRLGVANISNSSNKWSNNIKNQVLSLGIGVVL